MCSEESGIELKMNNGDDEATFAYQALLAAGGDRGRGTQSSNDVVIGMDEERVAVAGAHLWCTSSGKGPGLVLAHGGPGMSDNLASVAGMVEDLLRVHRFDQRACGRSTGSGNGQTVVSAVEDLDALRQHWGYNRWVVGGHSWGAALALFYAVMHPERTRAVVYISGPGVVPPPATPHARSRMDRLSLTEQGEFQRLQQLANTGDRNAGEYLARLIWKTDFSDPKKSPDFTRSPLFAYPRNDEAARSLRSSADEQLKEGLSEKVRELDMPVLVLHGDDDPLPVEGALDLAGRLPVAELVVLDGVGHNPWLEDPRPMRVALRKFLSHLPA